MICVVDTHALVWFLRADARISLPARDALKAADNLCVVPTIALAELRFLHARGRIDVSLAEVRAHLHDTANFSVHPFDEHVLDRMPDALEIHDAIIVGTALALQDTGADEVALITNDRQITDSGLVQVIW